MTIFIFAILGLASAKPQVFVAPAAEVVASPYVVSSSSQYVARNYNGLSAAYVAESPVISAYSYPYAAYPSYVF